MLYSDFVFGNSSANYSKIKRYNISLSSWENVNTGQLVASSNLHKLVAADGEVYAVAGASGQTPLLIKVSENGSAEKREINTSIGNYISLGLDVSGSGTVCVGVFSAKGNAEVYYYDGGVQKQLGSSPCNTSQSADLLVFGKSVYVTSVADPSGILAVRTKDLPQKAAPRLLARDGTNKEIWIAEATLPVDDVLAKKILSLGAGVKVLEPAELQKKTAELAAAVAEVYS